MEYFTSLKSFLLYDKRGSSYHYRVTLSDFLKSLIENKKYSDFTTAITLRFKKIHKTICDKIGDVPLEDEIWHQIELKLDEKVRSMKDGEKIIISMNFEIDYRFEFSVELLTTIY